MSVVPVVVVSVVPVPVVPVPVVVVVEDEDVEDEDVVEDELPQQSQGPILIVGILLPLRYEPDVVAKLDSSTSEVDRHNVALSTSISPSTHRTSVTTSNET